MQQLTRTPAASGSRQALVRPARHVPQLLACPLPTRLQPARFKEGDEVQRSAQKAADKAGQAGDNIKGVATDLADKVGKPNIPDFKDAVRATSTAKGPGLDDAVQLPLTIPAFTRRREVFAGRLAMLGFLAACVGEVVTPGHVGPISQVTLATGIQQGQVIAGLAGLIAFNAISGLAPFSPTFSEENQRDVAKRPDGPPSVPFNPTNPSEALGFSGWGFTKRNEVFVGRTAMLGFLAAVLGEIRSGGAGPIGQIAGYLGKTPDAAWYNTFVIAFWVSTAAILFLATFFPSQLEGKQNSEKDMY